MNYNNAYFPACEMSREELVEMGRVMFAALRERIDAMSDSEYREYKRRQTERYANA
jgi:hypothetical protein